MAGSVKIFFVCKRDVSAVQCHPRSLILAPIESALATGFPLRLSTIDRYSNLFGGFSVLLTTPYFTLHKLHAKYNDINAGAISYYLEQLQVVKYVY